MIDNILYAVSLHHSLRFLTLDDTLREFITSKGDDEFNRAMEEALREDRELLGKLAKI